VTGVQTCALPIYSNNIKISGIDSNNKSNKSIGIKSTGTNKSISCRKIKRKSSSISNDNCTSIIINSSCSSMSISSSDNNNNNNNNGKSTSTTTPVARSVKRSNTKSSHNKRNININISNNNCCSKFQSITSLRYDVYTSVVSRVYSIMAVCPCFVTLSLTI